MVTNYLVKIITFLLSFLTYSLVLPAAASRTVSPAESGSGSTSKGSGSTKKKVAFRPLVDVKTIESRGGLTIRAPGGLTEVYADDTPKTPADSKALSRLHVAVCSDDSSKVNRILSLYDFSPDVLFSPLEFSPEPETLVHAVARSMHKAPKEHLLILRQIIDHAEGDADFSHEDARGNKPLELMCQLQHDSTCPYFIEAVMLFIRHGASVDRIKNSLTISPRVKAIVLSMHAARTRVTRVPLHGSEESSPSVVPSAVTTPVVRKDGLTDKTTPKAGVGCCTIS